MAFQTKTTFLSSPTQLGGMICIRAFSLEEHGQDDDEDDNYTFTRRTIVPPPRKSNSFRTSCSNKLIVPFGFKCHIRLLSFEKRIKRERINCSMQCPDVSANAFPPLCENHKGSIGCAGRTNKRYFSFGPHAVINVRIIKQHIYVFE